MYMSQTRAHPVRDPADFSSAREPRLTGALGKEARSCAQKQRREAEAKNKAEAKNRSKEQKQRTEAKNRSKEQKHKNRSTRTALLAESLDGRACSELRSPGLGRFAPLQICRT
jgi:hypothetical protein